MIEEEVINNMINKCVNKCAMDFVFEVVKDIIVVIYIPEKFSEILIISDFIGF